MLLFATASVAIENSAQEIKQCNEGECAVDDESLRPIGRLSPKTQELYLLQHEDMQEDDEENVGYQEAYDDEDKQGDMEIDYFDDDDYDDEYDEDEPFSPWEYEEELQTLGFIQQALQCHRVMFQNIRPIPDAATWLTLREAYIEAVGPSNATIMKEILREDIPIKIGYSEGMGRGLFATADIPKGTQIYNYELHEARFYTGSAFRRFLSLLDRELACDITNWAWSAKEENTGQDDSTSSPRYHIAVALHESSLINTANKPEENNIDVENMAMRDITAGEELYQFYGDFVDLKGWGALGL